MKANPTPIAEIRNNTLRIVERYLFARFFANGFYLEGARKGVGEKIS
jgi:hypothetical protein